MTDSEVLEIEEFPAARTQVRSMREGGEAGSFEISDEQIRLAETEDFTALSQALIDRSHQLGCTVEWVYDPARRVFMFTWFRK